jgi:type IX secretion system PorP/SprF family membrane protein
MKLLYRHNILLLIFVLSLSTSKAQQYLQTSLKFENLSIINPAYKSIHDKKILIFNHRSQWVGFDGAPTSDLLVYNSETTRKGVAWGASLINDHLGPINTFMVHGNFSYQIKLSKTKKIAFGAKVGANIISARFSGMQTIETDPTFTNDNLTKIKPNAGLGVFYYTLQYYIGLSSPNVIPSKGDINVSNHYYLIGGGAVRLNKNDAFLLIPEGMLKMVWGAPLQFEANLSLLIKYTALIGVNYRTGDAVGINLGLEVVENLMVLYAYNYSYTNKTFTYNSGSHEIMLKYTLGGFNTLNKHKRRYRIGGGNYVKW